MLGLMQDHALTVDRILAHAARWHGNREIVSRSATGDITRSTWKQVHDRARQISHALLSLGVKPGDRIGTLAWNTASHLESWYGIMGIGAVCHTMNPRLHIDQLLWVANHAGDRIVIADPDLAPLLTDNWHRLPQVDTIVVMGPPQAAADPRLLWLEPWIADRPLDAPWGGFDENSACGLCYTSGTTGDPKGVLYSHRSTWLHTTMTLQADVFGIGQRDTVLLIVPMFHANAWGLAFSAPAVGARLVLPGSRLDGASIAALIREENVTFAAAVPTVWQMLLQHLDAEGGLLPTLRRVVIGGSAVSETMMRAFRDRYGVEVIHAWGMTETSPLGAIAAMTADLDGLPFEQQLPFRLKQGRPPLGVDLAIVDDNGARLPHDGTSVGRLMVAGPSVARAYVSGPPSALAEDGFFDTGDIASIDASGFMQITDRVKDVIKSGGEWISSIQIEQMALLHPGVVSAAVVGVPHPKWDERPILIVVLEPGASCAEQDILTFLEGRIARWWMPDLVHVTDTLPLGITGKVDKKALRQRYGSAPAKTQN